MKTSIIQERNKTYTKKEKKEPTWCCCSAGVGLTICYVWSLITVIGCALFYQKSLRQIILPEMLFEFMIATAALTFVNALSAIAVINLKSSKGCAFMIVMEVLATISQGICVYLVMTNPGTFSYKLETRIKAFPIIALFQIYILCVWYSLGNYYYALENPKIIEGEDVQTKVIVVEPKREIQHKMQRSPKIYPQYPVNIPQPRYTRQHRVSFSQQPVLIQTQYV